MDGWIKIDRKILDWELYKTPNMAFFFLHLLLKANHEPKECNGVRLEPGQLIVSRRGLSKETGLSEREVRTCFDRLLATHEMTSKTTHKFTIITICNYDKYKYSIKTNDPQNDPQNDHKQEYNNNNSIDITPNVVISKSKTRSPKNKPARVGRNGQVEMFGEDEGKKPAQQKKEFIPPTLDEVVDFFIQNNGTREQAESFFYTFDSLGWKNTKGTKITRWESRAKQWIIQDNKSNLDSKHYVKYSKFKSADERNAEAKAKRDAEFASHIAELITSGDSGEDASHPW